MSDLNINDPGELRPSYTTLNEPARLLGLSVGAWVALTLSGAIGYGLLSWSPLPWRVNFSAVVIGLGAPVILLILREPGTIGPGRLLLAVCAWRARPTEITRPDVRRPVRSGALRLDAAQTDSALPIENDAELPWVDGARA